MNVSNLLTKINFSALPDTLPTTWDLSPTYPNGALSVDQITARALSNGGWTTFGPITAFNQDTNVATFTPPSGTLEVEFARQTPRYDVYLDPLAVTSRVSQKNLQANADQGLYTATEWAAQFGIDAQAILLPDPATTPNQLGLIQQTQNRWGPDATWDNTDWNFQFVGGYLDRSHVRAQVLTSVGWAALSIDTGTPHSPDPEAPSNAPFRFIGDYQLFMDFSTLPEVPQGLIIYRRTPRELHVASPDDDVRITADNMDASARHAFFVAVELGEVLSQYVPPCDCDDVSSNNYELREDGSIELREDGSFELREHSGIGGFPLKVNLGATSGTNVGLSSAVGILLTGFDPTITYRVTLDRDALYSAWSAWATDHTADVPVTGAWKDDFLLTVGGVSPEGSNGPNTTRFGGAQFSYLTPEAAIAAFPSNLTITGQTSWTVWIEDNVPDDNRGGLSLIFTPI